MRFSRILERVEGVSQKSLTKVLRQLERDGMVTRVVFAEVPPRVEYAITELALEMLDLNYNATSKIYDAPYQLKANNGIYLIDDFGRQQCTPAEILNRWIVPMERRVDYLKFMSGGKITVPFEAFLIFSTNQNPEQLGDEAFLRRIQ